MTSRIIRTVMALFALATAVSCWQDELLETPRTAREGYVILHFTTDLPPMQEVVTKAVDEDGGGVQNMTLFCFDSYGLFITTVSADISATDDLNGTVTAEVPENTRTIHFLANQNMSEFKEGDARNHSESEVMALMEGSSGRMIYWARFSCKKNNSDNIGKQIADAGNKITMLRNHARVSVGNPTNNGYIEVTGLVAYNINAFGTVAPYHPDKGFEFDWETDEFVTLPSKKDKMSDITGVTTATSQYIFESENTLNDPVSIIIRGHAPGSTEDKYYRVLLVDEKGDQLLIRRNHHYILNIQGELSFGQDSFEAALTAAATNNIWISISDEVTEVEDQNYILSVAKTTYIIGEEDIPEGGVYTLSYTLKGKNGTVINDTDKPLVTWINNLVATGSDPVNNFDVENNEGTGTIRISLLSLGSNEKLEGTLLVKHGQLQRAIKVITIKKQSFVPSWVGTQVYGGMNATDPTKDRSHVTVMFTIPETCPAELFPMNVLISVNDLDIRSESGQKLPVVCAGDRDWYSSGDITSLYEEESEPDYKYLYTVEKAGVQRVYFENILSQTADYSETLYIEAEHFETMAREFTFSDSRNSITVTGLSTYTAKSEDDEFANDEYVFYRLVPQKKGANVQFDLQLLTKTSGDDETPEGTPFNAAPRDEFLLYSRYLNYYKDGDEGKAGLEANEKFDCTFYPDDSDAWWNTNNPAGGRMLMFKPRNPAAPTAGTGKYSIYMYTYRPVSAEVVRIASNLPEYPAVLSADANDEGKYSGNSYRSVTFELANYNPFRFGARVNYDEGGWLGEAEEPDRTSSTDDIPEAITGLEWTYEPDKRVDIGIDITSFKGSDGNSVDPFGESFEIYIDAPMLSIDVSRLTDNNLDGTKLKADPSVEGRFIYTVDADRTTERNYGTGKAENTDLTTGVVQTGERKTLPFIVKDPVSAGDIVISSNEEQVVYYAKTFRVTNKSISGTIKYNEDGELKDVPKEKFVSFERDANHSRIGAVTITADGQYELRLRKEYTFYWETTDPVTFQYENNGKTYYAHYDKLADLFASQAEVVLEPDSQE